MISHPRLFRLTSCLISLLMGFGLVVALNVLLRLPIALAAGPITVTTFNDELNIPIGNGDCSLREAIQAANTDAAVDACSAGSGADMIILPAGTYTLTLAGAGENLNATDDLDITGTLTLDGADMATTIINANNLSRALHVPTAGVTLTLFNLTVRNGKENGFGGGLLAFGPVVVSNTTFISNTAGVGAGGGACFNSVATVANTTFVSNGANTGGGASFGGAATLVGTTFLSNTASGGPGGGAHFIGAAIVTDTTFLSNTASVTGGGAYFSGAATMTGTTFTRNTAGTSGGGAYFDGAAIVTDTIFLNNAAGINGGGAYFFGAATVVGTTFISNTVAAIGGGGGAYFNDMAAVTDTSFLNNTSAVKGGGALFARAATVASSTFLNNTANNGGGAYFEGYGVNTSDFVNTLFAANRANSTHGAAMYAYNDSGNDTLTLRHITAAGPTVGSGSAMYILSGTVNITNTIVASYSVGLESAGGVLSENYNLFSDVSAPYSGTLVNGGNSLTGTAAFADTTLYKLSDASAAIDTGTDVGSTSDFEGDPRPVGAGVDIGWDEMVAAVSGLSASNDSPKQIGHAIAFTATVSVGTGVNYQWNFGDNSPISNLQFPTHLYAVPGNYTAIVTATNSINNISVSTPVTITEAAFKLYLPLIAR